MPLFSPRPSPGWLRPSWWTPLRADAALAAGLLAVQLLLLYVGPVEWWGSARSDLWVVFWTTVTLLPVAFRRRWLWPAVCATVVFIVLGAVDQVVWSGQGITMWVLAYTLAAYEPWWRAVLGSALLWLTNDAVFLYAHQAGYLNGPNGTETITVPAGLVANIVAMTVTFLIGRTMRARRETAVALAERAAVAEANQHAHAEQAVADERRRIARELHDVVAHHVSVIGVMATGARRMLNRNPAATDEALATIEQTSRTTLRELRRLLFVLRTTAEDQGDDGGSAGLTPQPGLSGVRQLVEQVNEAGLPVVLRVEGELGELDPGVELTAYRIVQEALTNTLKHAGPASAEVRLSIEERQLTIEVFDTGRGPRMGRFPADGTGGGPAGSANTGHGLLGMRERVAVYGGTLRTGPRPGGGFRVYARIPFEKTIAAALVDLSTGGDT